MKYDSGKHHRRSIRLQGYDYSQPGSYFITMVTKNRECLLCNVTDGEICLNDVGKMIQKNWEDMQNRFPGVALDVYTIMPNHIHGILNMVGATTRRGNPCDYPFNENNYGDRATTRRGNPCDYPFNDNNYGDRATTRVAPTGGATIGDIVSAFKSITTHEYIAGVKKYAWTPIYKKLWQRNYWEHII